MQHLINICEANEKIYESACTLNIATGNSSAHSANCLATPTYLTIGGDQIRFHATHI